MECNELGEFEVKATEDEIDDSQKKIRRRIGSENILVDAKMESVVKEVIYSNTQTSSMEIIDANTSTSALDSVNGMGQEKLLGISQQIYGKLKGIRRNIYEIGRLLSLAENTFINHGQFLPWIKQTFGAQLPYSTAWLYMKIFEKFKDNPKVIETYPVSVLLCMIQADFPQEVRTQLECHCDEFADVINAKQLKDNYTKVKKGEMTVYEFWEATMESTNVAFALLRNDDLRRNFDNYIAQLKVGLSRIDKGISMMRRRPEGSTVVPDSVFKDYYCKELDSRIENLQKLKADLGVVFDEPKRFKVVGPQNNSFNPQGSEVANL